MAVLPCRSSHDQARVRAVMLHSSSSQQSLHLMQHVRYWYNASESQRARLDHAACRPSHCVLSTLGPNRHLTQNTTRCNPVRDAACPTSQSIAARKVSASQSNQAVSDQPGHQPSCSGQAGSSRSWYCMSASARVCRPPGYACPLRKQLEAASGRQHAPAAPACTGSHHGTCCSAQPGTQHGPTPRPARRTPGSRPAPQG